MLQTDLCCREWTIAYAQLPPSRSPATAPSSAAPSAAASTRWSTSAPRTTTTATATTTTATRSPRTSPTSSSPSTTRRGLVRPDPIWWCCRHTPFHDKRCTRRRRRAIQGIFSRPQVFGEGPCRIHSLCGRCIEVFFFLPTPIPAYVGPFHSGELWLVWASAHAQEALNYLA